MIVYGINSMLWTMNLISGNDGDILSLIWLRCSQWSLPVHMITLSLAVWAATSYGTQADVYQSWSGSPSYAAVNSGTAMADFKYLMWNEFSRNSVDNYTLYSQLSNFGYDTNWYYSFYFTFVSGLLQIGMWVYSFVPFAD